MTQRNTENTIDFSTFTEPTDARIRAMTTGWDQKWGGAVGTGVAITYSFAGNFSNTPSYWASDYSLDNEPAQLAYLNASHAQLFRQGLAEWAAVANLTFTEVSDAQTAAGVSGVIRAAFSGAISGNTLAQAYLPGGAEAAGDVWFNPGAEMTLSTIVHELGHSLGLSHPNDDGYAAGYTTRNTVMSYNNPDDMLFRAVTPDGNGGYDFDYQMIEPTGPMVDDIRAIQYLYGANTSYRTGNDTYTFDPDTPFLRTIWDGGGIDAISVANFTEACTIDLRAAKYSSIRILSDALPPGYTDPNTVYDGANNLAIAYGVTIENATGGAGNDTLIGNTAGNILDGRGGADAMLGGGGNDTYYVNHSGDRVYETTTRSTTIDAGGVDLIVSTVSLNLDAYAGARFVEYLRLGAGAINATGNARNNIVYAGGGDNLLEGGTGLDTVAYTYADAPIAARLGLASALTTGGSGTDKITGFENLSGSRFSDRLTGDRAANVLIGGGGNDMINGSTGSDTLRGDSGADRFVFSTALGGSNVDRIIDFISGVDKIYLDDIVFAAVGAPSRTLSSASFTANKSGLAGDASDRVVYETDTGALFYDADGTGAGARVQFATLTGLPALQSSDFYVA